MTRYRILNAIFWLYIWLSDVTNTVVTTGEDFWLEKAKQRFRFNGNLAGRPFVLLGNATLCAMIWLVIDYALRRREIRSRAVDPHERPDNQWSDADKEQFKRLLDKSR
jgi:hypothetical protein